MRNALLYIARTAESAGDQAHDAEDAHDADRAEAEREEERVEDGQGHDGEVEDLRGGTTGAPGGIAARVLQFLPAVSCVGFLT